MDFFMLEIIENTLAMSFVILFLMGVYGVWYQRFPAVWRYYTWLIVVVSLLIPFRPSFSLPVGKISILEKNLIGELFASKLADNANAVMESPQIGAIAGSNIKSVTVLTIFFLIWVTGVIIYMMFHGIRYWKFKKIVRRWSDPVVDESWLATWEQAKMAMGCTKLSVSLRKCKMEISPTVFGFIKPVLLLPETGFSQQELLLVFQHELTHIERKDTWWKSLVFLATAIHWFNPVIHGMSKIIQAVCEASCDEKMLEKAHIVERRFYAKMVIEAMEAQSVMNTAFSTQFYGRKQDMKKRLYSIMETRRIKKNLAVLVCSIVIICGISYNSIFVEANSHGMQPRHLFSSNLEPQTVFGTTVSAVALSEAEYGRITQAALKLTGGGTVVAVQLGYKNNRPVYEVTVVNGGFQYGIELDRLSLETVSFTRKSVYKGTHKQVAGITHKQARNIVENAITDSVVSQVKQEYKNDVLYYDVSVWIQGRKYSAYVDAVTGQILYHTYQRQIHVENNQEYNTETRMSVQAEAAVEAVITVEAAKTLALEKTSGGSIVSCGLEWKDGLLVYEIEIKNGSLEYDLEIDAATGYILKFEQGYDG